MVEGLVKITPQFALPERFFVWAAARSVLGQFVVIRLWFAGVNKPNYKRQLLPLQPDFSQFSL
jgi:uncharacterized membrane protein (GlpM family)